MPLGLLAYYLFCSCMHGARRANDRFTRSRQWSLIISAAIQILRTPKLCTMAAATVRAMTGARLGSAGAREGGIRRAVTEVSKHGFKSASAKVPSTSWYR